MTEANESAGATPERIQIISGSIPPNARRNGARPAAPRSARPAVVRHGWPYVDADEVDEPDHSAEQDLAGKLARHKADATELANRIAQEWGCFNARNLVDFIGLEFMAAFLDRMNESRGLGEMQGVTNPGGYFAAMAWRARRAMDGAVRRVKGLPDPLDGPWNQATE